MTEPAADAGSTAESGSEEVLPEAPFGFTWGQTDDVTWLRTADGDYKRVDPEFLATLRDLATDDGEPDTGRSDGGLRAALDEEAVRAVQVLAEEGYLDPGGKIERVETPPPVDLRPRVLAFGVVLALLSAFVGWQLLVSTAGTGLPPGIGLLEQLAVASGLFLGMAIVHELGHYTVANRYFDPTIRPALHNGFLPSLVTHTTGAWACPPSVRIWISLAGPFADATATLVLAFGAVTVLPWGDLLAAFVVFEYVRILFALNPLLQGDGYWIVVDGLGLTNLHTRGKRDLLGLRPSWPAAYVLASSAFSVALLGVMALFLGTYLGLV